MNQFEKDLELGRIYEAEWLKYVEYDTYEQAPSDRAFTDWDIKTIKDNENTTFEIKVDRISYKYGNLAIEFERTSGKKSGINVTRADFWIHFALDGKGGYTVFKFPRRELKQMIRDGLYKDVKETWDGSRFVLMEMKNLKRYVYKVVY